MRSACRYAAAAVARLQDLYAGATGFLLDRFVKALEGNRPVTRHRAFYPELRLTVPTHPKVDSRLSFGHVVAPGSYSATITRPDLFENYLKEQIGLLIRNHGVPVTVGVSDTPMPVHFAVAAKSDLAVPQEGVLDFSLRDVFDVPDLSLVGQVSLFGGFARVGVVAAVLLVFTLMLADFFDTMGTIVGVGAEAGLLDEEGGLPGSERVRAAGVSSARSVPWSMIPTRSEISAASSMSWVVTRTVAPASRSARTWSQTNSLACGSSPVLG